ncbi:MAG: ATP-binding cassette domain-containing protein [Eubacterium sp.]|nr:ATP-binding cassette domain-containing protein [Eubacterium sp.]
MAAIELTNISKTYTGKAGAVQALREVSLSIEEGEIFGVIGLSGAGKSTLVRCINYLEQPESGTVRVGGSDLASLSGARLRKERQDIAMIFQHFNLLQQRNVLDNVAFPLEIAGLRKKEAREKAKEYLEIVGLADKQTAYPVQLSGGQQQRVAIARALAGQPKILLSDEATSALDPKTTRDILRLLKDINRQYHITIVLITHEMRVIQEICDRVAVLHHGVVAETGTVREVFTNPKSKATKQLLLVEQFEQLEEAEDDGHVDIAGKSNEDGRDIFDGVDVDADGDIAGGSDKKIRNGSSSETRQIAHRFANAASDKVSIETINGTSTGTSGEAHYAAV